MKLIIRILANAAAILIAAKLVPGFIFDGTPLDLLIAAVVIGFINAIVKPVVELVSLPVIFLTLGLFYIIINVVLLMLAAKFIPHLAIHGFWAALWGVIIISLINNFVTHFSRGKNLNNY